MQKNPRKKRAQGVGRAPGNGGRGHRRPWIGRLDVRLRAPNVIGCCGRQGRESRRQDSPTSPGLETTRLGWTPIGAHGGLVECDGRYIRLERLRGPSSKFSRRVWTARSRWWTRALTRLRQRPEYIYHLLNLRLHRPSPLISSHPPSTSNTTTISRPSRRPQTPSRPTTRSSPWQTSPRAPARPSPPPLRTPALPNLKRNPERRSQKAPSEQSRAATPAEFAERYVRGVTRRPGAPSRHRSLTPLPIQKCDENPNEHGACQTCVRLRLQCLGFGAKRPDWMRVRRVCRPVWRTTPAKKNFISRFVFFFFLFRRTTVSPS